MDLSLYNTNFTLCSHNTDFEPRIRAAVIKYMIKRFGRDQVANIGTFGMLKIKSAIQDVARVCGIPSSEVFPVTKRIPQDVNDLSSLDELEYSVPVLKTFLNKHDSKEMPIRWFINGVRGAHRQPGSHAAGVLVSSENLSEAVALIQSKKNVITGWLEGSSGHELSDLGYAKFDILGLNNLQVVNDAISLIKKRRGKKITTEEIDSNLDDPFVYDNIVKAGDHYGVFQFESNVAGRTLNLIKPDKFSELSDISALIRPGTLMMGIPEMYANRKFGRPDENDKVWSLQDVPPSVQPVLKDTYGLMCIAGDTEILTNQGNLTIKEIVDDTLEVKVLTLNEDTKEYEWKEINKYYDNGVKEIIKLEFANGYALKCTSDHKIFTNNRGWVEAQQLDEKDDIVINSDFDNFA